MKPRRKRTRVPMGRGGGTCTSTHRQHKRTQAGGGGGGHKCQDSKHDRGPIALERSCGYKRQHVARHVSSVPVGHGGGGWHGLTRIGRHRCIRPMGRGWAWAANASSMRRGQWQGKKVQQIGPNSPRDNNWWRGWGCGDVGRGSCLHRAAGHLPEGGATKWGTGAATAPHTHSRTFRHSQLWDSRYASCSEMPQ